MDLRTYVGASAAPQLDFNALKKKRRQIQRNRRKSTESSNPEAVEESVQDQLGVLRPNNSRRHSGEALNPSNEQASSLVKDSEDPGAMGSKKFSQKGTAENLGWSVDEALQHSRRKQEELVHLEKKSVRGCLCFRRPDFEHINEEKAKMMAERLQEEVSRDHSRRMTGSRVHHSRPHGVFRVSQQGTNSAVKPGMGLVINTDEPPVMKFSNAPSSPSCLKKDGGRRSSAMGTNGRVRLHFVEGDQPKVVDFSQSMPGVEQKPPSMRLLLDAGEDPEDVKRQVPGSSHMKRGSTGSLSQPQSAASPPPIQQKRRRSRAGSIGDVRSPIAEKLEALAGNHWTENRPRVPSTFSGGSQLETIKEEEPSSRCKGSSKRSAPSAPSATSAGPATADPRSPDTGSAGKRTVVAPSVEAGKGTKGAARDGTVQPAPKCDSDSDEDVGGGEPPESELNWI